MYCCYHYHSSFFSFHLPYYSGGSSISSSNASSCNTVVYCNRPKLTIFVIVYSIVGNGIKTVLVNVIDIGQALNREAPEITKFFGCELGSQTTFSADTERSEIEMFYFFNH